MSAAELIRGFAEERPLAVRLAEAVSLAVLIDRPLLRRARLKLVPEADPGTEADLWTSPLIQTRSPDGLVLIPEVAQELRKNLAAEPDRLAAAWELTRHIHCHLSPALQVEEEIAWLSVSPSPEAAGRIEELLQSVLAALVVGERRGLAHWAARALPMLPSKVREREIEMVQILEVGATLRLGGSVRPILSEGGMPEWIDWVVPADLPRVPVGVRLLPGAIELKAGVTEGSNLLQVPETDPLLIDVIWISKEEDGRELSHVRQVTFRQLEVVTIPVAVPTVRFRNAMGEIYQLSLVSFDLDLDPPLHNLPFPRKGNLFQGRDEDFWKLIAILEAENTQAIAITQITSISGLGGIGKTSFAVEYAWCRGGLYTAVLFVRADSPETLHRSLASLAVPSLLSLPEWQEREEEVVGGVLRWLRENHRWLMIVDNVDTPEAAGALLKLLPDLSKGRVLITSRLTSWTSGVRTLALGILSHHEAVRFLLQRTEGGRNPSTDDAEQASRLVDLLGGFPLTLEIAASYIVRHWMRLADYLETWERSRAEELAWVDPLASEYPYAVAVTWQQTFRQLDPAAATILRLASFLASAPVPVDVFLESEESLGVAVELLYEEIGWLAEPNAIDVALENLAAYSLIGLEGGGLAVHPLVQEMVRRQIPENKKRMWIERALWIVDRSAAGDPSDVRTWPTWDALRPHVAQIIAFADAAGIFEPTSRLMSALGQLLEAKGLYSEAEPLLRRVLAIEEELVGPDHPDISGSLNNLAQLLLATNRLEEAESLVRRALAIDETTLGPEHPDVARGLDNLAQVLREENRLQEAEPLMRRSLGISSNVFGADHPRVAVGLNNLAQLLQATGRLSEAEPLARRALAIDEAVLGPEHPRSAVDLHNLAVVLRQGGRISEAQPLIQRALGIFERVLGPDHPHTKMAQGNLAALERELTEPSSA